jgi:peptidoglycan/LPS O-acetylase OafA/YrhL
MIPAQPNRQYYPALDGLRGLAILLVLVYHNFGFINYFFFGWLGVDLFFVLSGFLITDILLKTLDKPNYLKNFYGRRLLRIFPLYYLALVLFIFIIPGLFHNFQATYYRENQVWMWTYLQNWLYIFKPAGDTTGLHHLWSLAVEEQFYLLWPLVILLLRKPGRLLVFITLVLVAVIGLRLWIWNYQVTNLAYFNLYTFSRIDGLCIGCMIALLQRINPGFLSRNTYIIVLFFAVANFIFYFINRQYSFSFPYLAIAGYTTFAMTFGLLVNEAVSNGTPLINTIFNFPLLRFFGRISYGLYVFHWPVYLIMAPMLYQLIRIPGNLSLSHFICSLLATGTAVLISVLSFRYFEQPFLKLKQRFS